MTTFKTKRSGSKMLSNFVPTPTLAAFLPDKAALWGRQANIAPDGKGEAMSRMLAAALAGDLVKLKDPEFREVVNLGDYDNRTALHLAAAGGHLECVRYLVEEYGAVPQVDRFGELPVRDAVLQGHLEVVLYFRELDWSFQTREVSAAPAEPTPESKKRMEQISEAALEKWNRQVSFSPDLQEVTGKLCKFAFLGETQSIISMVKEQTADINSGDYDGRTPLHLAAAGGKLDTIKALIEHLGAVPQRDRWSQLPLDDAKRIGATEAVAYLEQLHTDRLALGNQPKRQVLTEKVTHMLVTAGMFTFSVACREAEQWINEVGWDAEYLERRPLSEVAEHLLGFMFAKRHAQVTRKEHVETERVDNLTRCGFFISSSKERHVILRTEQKVTELIASCAPEMGIRVHGYTSSLPAGTSAPVHLVNVEGNLPFPNASESPVDDSDDALLRRVATAELLQFGTPKDARMARRAVAQAAPIIEYEEREDCFEVTLAVQHKVTANAMVELSQVFHQHKLQVSRYHINSFANGVIKYQYYVRKGQKSDILAALSDLSTAVHLKRSSVNELFMKDEISAETLLYIQAAGKFVFHFVEKETPDYVYLSQKLDNPMARVTLDRLYLQAMSEVLTQDKILDVFRNYPKIVKLAYADFFNVTKGGQKACFNDELYKAACAATRDDTERKIFRALATFNAHVRITNFFCGTKEIGTRGESCCNSCVAFRLDPGFLKAHVNMFPELPYGIYLLVGREFYGFHCRFRDVARGGIRLIRSRDAENYRVNASTVFEETYNLSYTQQLKNKDIPEGGSKGTILLELTAQTQGRECFAKYLDALLDCMMLDSPGMVSQLEKPEFLFFGPDEGTADVMELGAQLAKDRGYKYWKSITTGKPSSIGGIPHDLYGMTTRSVHIAKLSLLAAMGVKEENVTKFQTGGPDGDLGSNEVLISKDRTVGIVDGSGVVYDPEGLNRPELIKLARARSMVSKFDRSLLGAKGFMVGIDDRDVTLPDGTVVEDGTSFRNVFHLSKYATADLFVPCGGRPKAVTLGNVEELFVDGHCKFKYIVEGANLFFTDDARRLLESRGVHIIKDATTNKGGVTSSSFEVLAGLALSNDKHDQSLCLKSGMPPPPAYNQYALQIAANIEENARLEFQAMWRENQRGITKTDCTVLLSKKINSITDFVASSLSVDNEQDLPLIRTVLQRALPPLLVEQEGLDGVMRNIPSNYLMAIVSSWIGAKYVYRYGLTANEHCYFLFMRSLIDEANSPSSAIPPAYEFPSPCAALL